MKPKPLSPEQLGILTDEAKRGVGAQTLLSTLGPVIEQRLEQLLAALDQSEPVLERLLDLRAKISTMRALKRELAQVANAGHEAGERLSQL